MKPGYQHPDTRKRFFKDCASAIAAKVLIAYFLVSTVTIPFLDRFWIGEIAVLAIIQLPKTVPAIWLRTAVLMKLIRLFGLSRGSFSPDYIMTHYWGVAIIYVVPLVLILIGLWFQTRLKKPYLRLVLLLLAAATLDFIFFLIFCSQPGITIY